MKRLHRLWRLALLCGGIFGLAADQCAGAEPSADIAREGMVTIARQERPAPAGTERIAVEGGDFEGPQVKGRWGLHRVRLVREDGAPQGRGFARMEQVAGAIAHFPQVEVRPGVQG